MIITIKSKDGHRVETEIPDDSDIHDALDSIYGLLVSWGFHHDSVRDGIISLAEEYEKMGKRDI